MPLPTIAGLWVGDTLSLIEQICIQSFLDHGHKFILYSYTPVHGAPRDAEVRDANEIMPSDQISYYAREKSPALHSNMFRYAMLRQTDYIWADVDMLALRPFDFQSDYVFGWESESLINTAVMKLPKSSQTLHQMSQFTPDTRQIDPNITKKFKRVKAWIKTFGRGTHISQWKWGTTGPIGFTKCLIASGEAEHALPIPVFYPIYCNDHDRFLQPNGYAFDDIPDETYGVHLWGKFLRNTIATKYDGIIPPDSFLAQAKVRHLG